MFSEKDVANFAEFILDENIFRHDVTINRRCFKFEYKTLAVNLFYVFMTSYQDNMKKYQLVGRLFLKEKIDTQNFLSRCNENSFFESYYF